MAQRVLAAGAYLDRADPHQETWLGQRSGPTSAWAALAALNLAAASGSVTIELWKKWAAITIGLPFYSPKSPEALAALRRKALDVAPDELRTAIATLLDAIRKDGGGFDFESRVGVVWDARVSEMVQAVVRNPLTAGNTFQSLLEALFKHDADAATSLSREFLAVEPRGIPLSEKSVSCAALLLSSEPRENWDTVWPYLDGDASSCEAVLASLKQAVWRTGRPFYQSLDTRQLGTVYRRMLTVVPYSGDVQHPGVFTPSRRDELQELRDEILRFLSQRGDGDALREFEAIRVEHPELAFLSYYAVEARELYLDRSWVPPSLAELGELFSNPEKRVIRTGWELADSVHEAFDDIQASLCGETPDVDSLWNEDVHGKLRPKSEGSLSNYLANRLRERLGRWRSVVLHREVEIKSGLSGVEKTDIYVDAVGDVTASGSRTVSLVIEVKGCWHSELLTAMETQLVNGYMKTARLAHGLFAAFWFDPRCWDPVDRSRRMKVGQLTLQELGEKLRQQASLLTARGSRVRSYVFDGSVIRAISSPSKRGSRSGGRKHARKRMRSRKTKGRPKKRPERRRSRRT